MKYLFLFLTFVISLNLNAQSKKEQIAGNGVTDIDSNFYNSVVIGTQEWMSENLDVSTFRNGDPIPHIQDFDQWMDAGKAEQPAWCYYNNKSENGDEYGKLYNWYAVMDARGIAPEGWHVSSSAEWLQLVEMLGGEEEAAIKLKSVNLWKPSDYIENQHYNGNNISGMNIKPSGGRFTRLILTIFITWSVLFLDS